MSEIINKKHILVTGIQRSGTTFTSTILVRAPLIIYLPEPFNPDYGIEGTSKHFPIIDMQNLNDRNKLLLKDIFTYKARFKKNIQGILCSKKQSNIFLVIQVISAMLNAVAITGRFIVTFHNNFLSMVIIILTLIKFNKILVSYYTFI